MVTNTTLAIAGICSTVIVGYCMYFDKKRRSDPDFKKNLRESKNHEMHPQFTIQVNNPNSC